MLNWELIRAVVILIDEGTKSCFSNTQALLNIASLNLFAQVAFDEFFALTVGESLVQLYHNQRPLFGLRLWFLRSSLLIRK